MDKTKKIAGAALRLIGEALLVDLGIFTLVSLSCLIGTRCTGILWGERLFWAGLFILVVAGGVVVTVLGAGKRPNYREVAKDGKYEAFDDPEEEAKYARRGRFAVQAVLTGMGIILVSVLIDTLARR